MSKCPVCSTETASKINNTPYWSCPSCDCWFQDPLPPKVYEADHEKDENGNFTGHNMSDFEKGINKSLAESIFNNFLGSKTGKMLDVGSKYPYLSYCFKNLGCEAFGMDNIEIVPEYSKELDVPMLMADFEALTEEQIREWTHVEKFQLITMIHMFEHLYNPLEALKKIKSLLADDGVLFLRLPSHDVSGFERDLTPGHFTIHPFFHTLSSLLELLVQGQDLFTVDWTAPMDGAGQRDVVLRPIKKKPQVWCGMIVKNEERDLPRCLQSIEDAVDGIVILDTGSTDKTEEAAKACWSKPMIYQTYTGASKQDESGDWKLWDFGKARREFAGIIESNPDADYLIWMDADDKLLTPNTLKRAFYLSNHDVFGVMIETSGLKWVHHRAWKTKLGISFAGKIHEYPVLGNNSIHILEDVVIYHDAAPGIGENSNQRNLRILEAELEENPNDTRIAFYLANTHKDAGRFIEAIKYYDHRIKLGAAYWDEWMFSYLYKGRCERAAGLYKEAEKTLLEGLSNAPNWSEFWQELGYMAFAAGEWRKAIGYCFEAASREQEPTQLWREPSHYRDQPRRLLSFCYQNVGDIRTAYAWALEAKDYIGVPDSEWDARIEALRNLLSPSVEAPKKIALVRPGAIGDILMICNVIPELRAKYPDAVIDFFTKTGGLETILTQAGVNSIYDSDTFNPSNYTAFKYLIGYPIPPKGNYPEERMQKHLLEYFLEEVMEIVL